MYVKQPKKLMRSDTDRSRRSEPIQKMFSYKGGNAGPAFRLEGRTLLSVL